MNAAEMMETCPDSETLAAFSDGALDEKMRLEVMQHVADCGQCQHELVELDAAKRELKLELGPDNVRPGPFGRRWIAPLAAAAAIVVVLFGVPSIRDRILGGAPMGKLIKAANQAPERSTVARLSGDFAYRGFSPKRGHTEEEESAARWAIELAAIDAAQRAQKSPSSDNLHAAGVGDILMKDRADEAVQLLEAAAQNDPRSAAILTDLSAAYLARRQKGDDERALDAATRAWNIEHTPAAAWNRALALGDLNRTAQAIDAWHKYLELDPSSPWAEEVKTKHLTYLLPEK